MSFLENLGFTQRVLHQLKYLAWVMNQIVRDGCLQLLCGAESPCASDEGEVGSFGSLGIYQSVSDI